MASVVGSGTERNDMGKNICSNNSINSTQSQRFVPLAEVIEFLPETKTILELVNNFFYARHNDEDLPKFTAYFKQVMDENEQIFNALSTQQKAQLLFEQYRKTVIAVIEKFPQYANEVNKLVERFPDEKNIPSLIRTKVENEIYSRHSTLITFSLTRLLISHPQKEDYAIASLNYHNPSNVTHLLKQLSVSVATSDLFRRIIE